MNTTKLFSFDVFDTILLRNEKSEPFRFYEIAERVAQYFLECGTEVTTDDVFLARYSATETTYRFSKKVHNYREGSLDEIYEGIIRILNISNCSVNKALQIELNYEKENLTFNTPLWKKTLQAAQENQAPIILISDMYMQGRYIEQLLVHHRANIFEECQKLYSSADYTVSKASGLLFDTVLQDFDVQPETCLHTGDNFITDFQSPKQKGWNAVHLPIEDNRREKINQNLVTFRNTLHEKGITVPHIERAVRGLSS